MSNVYFKIQKRQNSGKGQGRNSELTLEGRLFVANRMTEIKEVTTEDTDSSYSKRLEKALIELCRQMDIPVPMWMKKNTKEFAAFGQTIFFREQYTENVRFDRFQIRVRED
jgi:hypothetical protein